VGVVVLHIFIRTREGLFYEGNEKVCSKSSHRILNYDYGRERLSRAQRLRNQLADYFSTPGAIPSQWSYINLIQLTIVEDEE
jgi:hypothetical protein